MDDTRLKRTRGPNLRRHGAGTVERIGNRWRFKIPMKGIGRFTSPLAFLSEEEATLEMEKKARELRRPSALKRLREEHQRSKTLVYFVQAEGGGPIKIGIARNVRARLRALQTSHPLPLGVITQMPGGRAKERELHRRFVNERLNGEWFRPSPGLLQFIAEVASKNSYANRVMLQEAIGTVRRLLEQMEAQLKEPGGLKP